MQNSSCPRRQNTVYRTSAEDTRGTWLRKARAFAVDFNSSASACAGARLFDILKAGEWKSPAFLLYCDMHKLESCAVVEAHLDESDGE